jgi:hypothetical protein
LLIIETGWDEAMFEEFLSKVAKDAMIDHPLLRNVEFRRRAPVLKAKSALAAVIAGRGRENVVPCGGCYSLGRGSFKGCFTLNYPNSKSLANGACANCVETNSATECEYRKYITLLIDYANLL